MNNLPLFFVCGRRTHMQLRPAHMHIRWPCFSCKNLFVFCLETFLHRLSWYFEGFPFDVLPCIIPVPCFSCYYYYMLCFFSLASRVFTFSRVFWPVFCWVFTGFFTVFPIDAQAAMSWGQAKVRSGTRPPGFLYYKIKSFCCCCLWAL